MDLEPLDLQLIGGGGVPKLDDFEGIYPERTNALETTCIFCKRSIQNQHYFLCFILILVPRDASKQQFL